MQFQTWGATYDPAYNTEFVKVGSDPVSGTTFLLDTMGKPYLNIHGRDGTPLPGNPLALEIAAKEAWGAGEGRLAVVPGGAWTFWDQGTADIIGSEAVALLVDTTGKPMHSGFILPRNYPMDGGPPTYAMPVAVVPRGGMKAWFLAAALIGGPRWHTYVYSYDGSSFDDPIPLFELGLDEGPFVGDVLVLGAPDDPWLALPGLNRRVVHIVPGCVYKSDRRMKEEDAGAGGAGP